MAFDVGAFPGAYVFVVSATAPQDGLERQIRINAFFIDTYLPIIDSEASAIGESLEQPPPGLPPSDS